MENAEIRMRLLLMHARDKRLSLVSFAFVTLVVLVLIGIISRLGRNYFSAAMTGMFGEGAPFYYKLLIPGILLIALVTLFLKIRKIQYRPRQIDDIFNKLQQGSVAESIIEEVRYKLTIPLGKIELKLFPIDYLSFGLSENPGQRYSLPVHNNFVTEFKTLLSGADMGAIAKSRQELYKEPTKEEVRETSPQTPIKSLEEFKTFIKSNLAEDIEQTESARKAIKTPSMIYLGLAIFFILVFSVIRLTSSGNGMPLTSTLSIVVPILVAALIGFFFIRPKIAKKAKMAIFSADAGNKFKVKVLSKIITFINADTQYAMHGHATLNDFLQSGLFSDKQYTLSGKDLIIGHHSGVPFQLSDLHASYKPNFSNTQAEPEVAFSGQFFMARFNKSFSSSIYLIPKGKNKKKGAHLFQIDNYMNSIDRGEKVLLEDPEFMDLFEVYASDQIEARYILTPALMERIKTLSAKTEGMLLFSFKDQKIFICNHSCRYNFELNISTSITEHEYLVLEQFYTQLTSQLSMIDELNLNTKIWR